ncbi:Molybdate-binding protein ModA [Methylophilaceae bacterium]|nr:Molybdate-binding protein ModA [Methylophilaceae bacterium]
MIRFIFLLVVSSLGLFPVYAHAEQKITVFAAASLTNAISEITAGYEAGKPIKLQNSFAASSALAKQIENGAPAQVFISADQKWMNYLGDKKLIDAASRFDLLNNKLALIAPKGRAFQVQFDPAFDLAGAFDGKLCTGEVESVPVGIYAKQALGSLGWWDGLKQRIVGAQDVRAALTFVERGECAAGIVYETDARVSDKVELIATFPAGSHEPVVYPAALVGNATPEARAFLQYLKSEQASQVFIKYGFTPVAR